MALQNEDMPLPKDQMPSCWTEDVRMTALFAPFRIKTLNPTDYESKMKFWTDVLRKWCRNRGSFNYDELCTSFQRKGKYPACFETVMEQMIKDGELCLKSSVNHSQQGWIGWGFSQMMRPASKAATLVAGIMGKGGPVVDRTARYVHAPSLKSQGLDLLSNHSGPAYLRIGSPEELWNAAGKEAVGDSMEMVLTWLRSQNLATCTRDGKLYKLSLDASTPVRPLTDGEMCLPRLERARKALEGSILNMKDKSAQSRLAAKQALAQGNKSMAMGHLRQKKFVEIRLEKALSSLDSLEHLTETVKQSHSDAEIFDAFKSGLGALKGTMKSTGLEEDNVMDTMDEIKESLDTYNDIESAISQPIGMSFDRDELEAELMALLAADEAQGGAGDGPKGGVRGKDMFHDLPDIPDTDIQLPKGEKKYAEREEDFHMEMERRLKNLRLVSDS